MQKLFVTFYFTFLSSFLFYNNINGNTLDSLLIILQEDKIDTTSQEYLDLLLQITTEYHLDNDFLSIAKICERIPQSSYSDLNSETNYRLRFMEARAYYYLSDYKKAIDLFIPILKVDADFVVSKDSSLLYRLLGDLHFHLGDLQTSYKYHLEALKIYEASGNKKTIAQFYYSEGLIFFQQKKYSKALKSYFHSLELMNESGDTSSVSDLYSVIGEIYFEIDSLDLALSNQLIAFHKDSLSEYQYGMGYGYYSLGKTYAALGNLNYAMKLHKKGLKIRNDISDKEEATASLAEIGMVSSFLGNYSQAQNQLMKALKLAKELETKPLIQKIYQYLSQNAAKANDFKTAHHFQRAYFLLKDSLINEKSIKNIEGLQSKYKLEKKEQQIALLKKEQELNYLYWKIAGFGLILLFGFIFSGKKMYDKQLKYNNILSEKNDEIKAKNQKLERANEDLEQFAYISSHDLKAPLRTVGSFANLLQRRYRKVIDEEGQEFLGYIIKGVKHMNVLLEDVYSYTHLDKEPNVEEVVDLNVLVEKTVFQLDDLLNKKQATVDFEPLPKIYGNTTFLGQVFQNLIQNGIKFTKPNTNPHIQISAETNGNEVQINIQDNGIGISEEFQTRIFTIFRRLHTSEEYSGTGVGLAICKKIIEKHNGKIWVESDGKSGSCFCFTLRLTQQKPHIKQPRFSSSRLKKGISSTKKKESLEVVN